MVLGDLVLPNPREQHDGTAVGVGELGEEILIGDHAEKADHYRAGPGSSLSREGPASRLRRTIDRARQCTTLRPINLLLEAFDAVTESSSVALSNQVLGAVGSDE